jgi:ABC-type cobalamin/Fe3+-siderophores transport system ATPase subunit
VSPSALSAHRLVVDYGRGPVLRSIDLDIQPGEVVGIVGPSGCGKTTLLKAFAGVVPANAGRLMVHGTSLTRDSVHRHVSFVPQSSSVNPGMPMTAIDAVMLGLAGRSRRGPTFSRKERHAAGLLLERLGVAEHAGRQVGELSGGQLQRVLIARALITEPSIVLMDEPTGGLDLKRLREVLMLVRDLHRGGTTVVLTTHDLNWVAAHMPRVVFLDGEIVADGHPRHVITTDVIDRTYGAPAKVLRDERGNIFVMAQTVVNRPEPARPADASASAHRTDDRRPVGVQR